MDFLKNKHLILAMFIAPVLAVIAYFAVDQTVSEKPHTAVAGSSYKLAAKSNCRYKSGSCTLENGDVEVKLRVEIIDNSRATVFLSSVIPLQNALVSFVDDPGYDTVNAEPTPMLTSLEQPGVWSASFNNVPSDKSILRLAVSISDTVYYAETTAIFIEYETSFSQENFSNK